jgi:alpha-L-fucosidase
MHTFASNDYETGDVPTSVYNPTNLDVHQWIGKGRQLSARYAVLTAKHMCGFRLWDAENCDYDIAGSPDKTDVVADVRGLPARIRTEAESC